MEDTRGYSSYVARIIGLIAALILIVLFVWFIISRGDEPAKEVGVVVSDDDTTEPYSATDDLLNGQTVNTGTNTGSQVAATDEEIAATVAVKNNQPLPATGPSAINILSSVGAVLLALSVKNFLVSRKNLSRPSA